MPLIASMFFTQGVTSSAPGVALIGTAGTPVTGANGPGSTSIIQNYEWTLIDCPSTSTLVPGFTQSGPTPTVTFTPDVAGGYLWQLKVSDQFGNFAKDLRTFQVLESSGRLIPPAYAPGSALNFGGQTRGWAKYIIDYLKQVDAGGGGGVSLAGDLLGTGSTSGTPRVGGLTGVAGVLAMAATAAALVWNSAAVTPSIGQQTASGSPGALMTVAAQTSTGIGSTGGGLALSSGGGLTSAGNLELQTGGTAQLRVTPTALINVTSNPLQWGTAAVASSGALRFPSATQNLLAVSNGAGGFIGVVSYTTTGSQVVLGGDSGALNAASAVVAAHASAGHFYVTNNGSTYLDINAATNATINFFSTTLVPLITQTTIATASATGATFTIQAQIASGTTSVGGNLALNAGSGTSTHGQVTFAVAGQATPGILFNPDISGLGTTQFLFHANCSQPKITLQSVSTAGTTLQIIGQTSTGAASTGGAVNVTAGAASGGGASTGGALNLSGGTGTTTGNVALFTGAQERFRVTSVSNNGAASIISVASDPLQFGTATMPSNNPTGFTGKGFIQWSNLGSSVTPLMTIRDNTTLTLPIISCAPQIYTINIGDPTANAGSNWSSVQMNAGVVGLNANSASGVQFWNKLGTTTAPITEFFTGAGSASILSVFGDGTASTIIKPKDTAVNSATGITLSVLGQSATGTTTTGGDLTIGGGTGTTTSGAVNFVNQTLAATANTVAGGAAIPALCKYLPVKIGGALFKLVVVNT